MQNRIKGGRGNLRLTLKLASFMAGTPLIVVLCVYRERMHQSRSLLKKRRYPPETLFAEEIEKMDLLAFVCCVTRPVQFPPVLINFLPQRSDTRS